MNVIALLPAHNESATILEAIAGLRAQTSPPNRIIVIPDNCTDDTEALARAEGAEIFPTVGNTAKKAGALNQALSALLPTLDDNDIILVQDADTILSEAFLEVAGERFRADLRLGAVSGVFYGEEGSGLLGLLQRNEYFRYAREIRRKGGRVMVLSGTSSAFRASALRDVAASRGSRIPGESGSVYDTLALTEDNEITLAMKTLAWKLVSPEGCSATTEVMTTVGDLWRQRIRWQRGAVENLLHYGWTPVTGRYWGQQAMIAFGVFALAFYIVLTVITAVVTQTFTISPLWASIGLIFVAEKVVTAWRGGWRSRLIAAPLVVEIFYDLFIQCVFVHAITQIVLRREAKWGATKMEVVHV